MNPNEQAPGVDDTPRAYKNISDRTTTENYNYKSLKVKQSNIDICHHSLSSGRIEKVNQLIGGAL